MSNVYQDAVVTKYNIFNSLFLSLPFQDIYRTGTLLPILVQESEDGFEQGKSPQQIIELFLDEYFEDASESDRRDLLFNFIKFIERQVVLFDSVEDAGFDMTHDSNGQGSITQLLNRVDSDELRQKLLKKLEDFCVRIVLTAHPTQFYPGKVLGIITDLEESIKVNDFVEVNHLLLQLGKTGFINKNKPTPFDEAVTLCWFLENVFYEAIPTIVKKLMNGLAIPINDWPHTDLFRLGFWPGGDRDGNPFVTPQITLQVADRLRQILLKCYWRDIKYLKRRLTFSGVEEIIAQAERKTNNAIYYPDQEQYTSVEELVADLMQAREILVRDHDSLFVEILDESLLKIKLFGFYFASLDIRQVSPKHTLAWKEILTKIEKQIPVFSYKDYETWDEKRQLEFLLSLQVELNESDFKDDITRDIYGSMLAIKEIQKRNGVAGCHRYVISNCESALNVVEVLALFKNVWKTDELTVDILPLFETVEDLANASEVMKMLYENPYYRTHLERRGNQQTIMVGFSDGTKDGGYLRANWSIFSAKEQLTKISREYDVKVTFFDGRGGPPGRGGGNNHAFYASLGKDIEDKEIQLTVQGQTISSNYGTVPTAVYNLERLFTAGLENNLFTGKSAKDQLSESDKALMEELAEAAYHAYLNLKNHPSFVPYLEKITPLRFYGQTKIGSRPDKRGSGGGGLKFEDLRAIPFVGSWAQMKQNIPGFYGFGAALETLKVDGKLDALKKLYKKSLFVRTLVENSMQSLMKAYYPATKYLQENAEFKDFWNMMYEEYERSIALMLEFSGEKDLLNQNPVTKESIRIRERIVLPLMTIQQYALQKLQTPDVSPKDAEVYSKLVIRAMFGIINAARNSA